VVALGGKTKKHKFLTCQKEFESAGKLKNNCDDKFSVF
jgi:hypothetical protein